LFPDLTVLAGVLAADGGYAGGALARISLSFKKKLKNYEKYKTGTVFTTLHGKLDPFHYAPEVHVQCG
jgi:hypothetical protein